MNTLQIISCCLSLIEAVLIEVPELTQETVTTIDTIGVPRLRLFYRTQEHLVETQGVSTILLDNHIWVHYVEHRLRHFLNRPTTDIFAILEDELSMLVLRSPSLEGLDVEHISADNVHIHMDRCYLLVVVLQVQTHELTLVCSLVLDTIHEVRASLNHTLIHEFLEGLILTRIT